MSTNGKTYAVLGATGNCGTALIQNILKSPHHKIHAYCRNQLKLQRLLPEIVDSKRVEVFEGDIKDTELIASCIRSTDSVFIVVTSNDNIPGCRLSQDSAQSIIAALENIKAASGPGLRMPKLVLLSSATIDDHLARHMPWWFRPIMLRAGSNVYDDLRLAEAFLRQHDNWVSTVYVKPGGLSVDVARGYQLSFEEEESFISYMDLAAAMIETADNPECIYDGKNVSVTNRVRGVGAKFPRGTPMCILVGLLRHFFPWAHPYLPFTGPS